MRGNIFIIGLGLIGCSVALAIKNTHTNTVITGFDINEKNLKLAKSLAIIDEEAETMKAAAEAADLIIIGTPVKQTEALIEEMALYSLKKDVIITDVGSTKEVINEKAVKLREQGYAFIGGHPMAGSHKTGPAAAKARLFENAFYLLTPGEGTGEKTIAELKAWLRGTQAKFIVVPPGTHDYLTGVISHFPHIIAAGLVHRARKSNLENDLVSRLAAGGFRDITRIASSSPEMWRDILLHNKEMLVRQLEEWNEEMVEIKQAIERNDGDAIYHYFASAKAFRDELPIKTQGAIPAFYDLYVDVPDYPGVISEITGYLAEERISITSIRILETREEIYGVLVISFQNEKDREDAEVCIKEQTNYGVYIM